MSDGPILPAIPKGFGRAAEKLAETVRHRARSAVGSIIRRNLRMGRLSLGREAKSALRNDPAFRLMEERLA